MRPADNLEQTERDHLAELITQCGDLGRIADCARGFAMLVRHREGADLQKRIHEAVATAIPELRSFANGLYKDFDALRNGLTLPWSSGPVDGNVNRVKMIKRQMFGRAKLDLLRKRVLAKT